MRGWKPWTVQPPAGTPIDWDSPYSPGLVDVIDFHGFPKSLLLGTPGVAFGTSQVYGAPTARGVGLDTLASFGGVYFSRADGLYAPANQTHVAVARFSAFSDIYAGLFCSANQSGSNSSFVFQYKGGTSYYLGSNLAAFSIPEVPKTFIGGVVVTAAAANSGGTNVFIDGSEVLATETVGATAYSHSKLVIFGERTSSAGYSCEGLYLLHLFYDQALAPAAAAALSLNPWQVFYKRRRAYGFVASSTISASISDAVTSSDAYTLSATAATAISAAATSSDAYALAATVPSAISEEIYPSDAYALAVTISAALDSSAAASSALSAVATIAATIAEAADAKDTLGVTATILAAIAEAATATDTQATGSVTSAAYAESATAAAIFNATVSIAATLTEAGLAADQIAAMATVAADLAESGAASDAYLRSVLLAVELLENAAAADELSAAAFEQIIDAAKTIITILQAQDTVNIVQALDTVNIVQAQDTLRILQ